jgi:predicted metalloprotease
MTRSTDQRFRRGGGSGPSDSVAGRSLRRAIAVVSSAVMIAACGHTVLDGRAVSMRFDPFRVAGLPASDGDSGPRTPPPPVTTRVLNSDGGDIDRAAVFAIKDVEDFWKKTYSDTFQGAFAPVATLVSVDPTAFLGPTVCGADPSELDFNALYCPPQDAIAWDRVDLLPVAKKFFGDMAINGLLAHEYGHAVQWHAGLVNENTPSVLVKEQQADCFAGNYMRWVAEAQSPRFTINTTTALDRVIAGAIAIRDPISTSGQLALDTPAHGTALDRVSAFQKGFDVGADGCAAIDESEIEQRRGNLPPSLFDPASPQSDLPITNDTLSTLMELLGQIFTPAHPPTLSVGSGSCKSGQQSRPVAYCPDANFVAVDLQALRQIGTPADEGERVLLQGDNTALSMLTSRYVMALEHERNLSLDGATAAMRTACLTGAAQRKMSEFIRLPSGKQLVLGAGDLDEAVSGLLTNPVVASDVNGTPVPSGFTRILAFRTGLLGDADGCYQRFA